MPDHDSHADDIGISRRMLAGFAALTLVMLVAGCGSDDDASPSLLFVQTSPAGTLTSPSQGEDFMLTLQDVPAHMVAFQDRPDRKYATVSIEEFVDSWEAGFASDPPNAVLTIADHNQEHLVVELSSPSYDEQKHTLSYIVRDPEGGTELANGFPADFDDVSLFIDDQNDMCIPPALLSPMGALFCQ